LLCSAFRRLCIRFQSIHSMFGCAARLNFV